MILSPGHKRMICILTKGKPKWLSFENKTIKLTLNNLKIEQKKGKIHLCVLLDSKLTFEKHVDNIFWKALKAMTRLGGLLNDRRVISIPVGIDLYKTLVRPYMEHAGPAYAGAALNFIFKVERVQKNA